jgi:hypothetical protein
MEDAKEIEVEVVETVSETETVAEKPVESPKKPATARKRKPTTKPTPKAKKTLTVVNVTVLKLQIGGVYFKTNEPVEITGGLEDERNMRKINNCLAKGIFKEV